MLDKSKNKGVNHHYLRNINVRWFEFDLSDLSEMPFEILETQRYSIIQGDLVICEGGEPGRCAVWSQSKPIMFQKALHRVRFYGGISSHFIANIIYLYCLTGFITKYFTGSSIKHLTGESLANIPIPVPPLNEQARILETIVSFNHIIYEIKHNKDILIKGILSVKTRILDLAMQGKLVPHDPTDEPASETLLRINPKAKIITDNPHYLPANKQWIFSELQDASQIIMGQSPNGDSINNEGDIEFHQGKLYFGDTFLSISPDRTNAPIKIIDGDSILLCVRAPVGIVNKCNRRICIGRGLTAISPSKAVSNNFLFYVLKYLRPVFEVKSTGSTFKAITGDVIKTIVIPVPPLNEQNRIVSKIEELYYVLDEIEANLQS